MIYNYQSCPYLLILSDSRLFLPLFASLFLSPTGFSIKLTLLTYVALLNTGMNLRFPNCYKPSRGSFVTSSEKLVFHTVNQQRHKSTNTTINFPVFLTTLISSLTNFLKLLTLMGRICSATSLTIDQTSSAVNSLFLATL
jgi:hypothetical protein